MKLDFEYNKISLTLLSSKVDDYAYQTAEDVRKVLAQYGWHLTYEVKHAEPFKYLVTSTKTIPKSYVEIVYAPYKSFWVHTMLNDTEWQTLKLKENGRGRQYEVDDPKKDKDERVFSYGRWKEGRAGAGDVPRHLMPPELQNITEHAFGMLHELCHGLSDLYGLEDLTHYHFYGLKHKPTEVPEERQKRYVVRPDPERAFKQILLDRAKFLETYKNVLETLKEIQAPQAPQPAPETSLELEPIVAHKADQLLKVATFLGYQLRITEGYRSPERQAELYAQGRTKEGSIVTNAKPGESWHQYKVAFDVVDRVRGYDIDWDTLGKIGEILGLEWGGTWQEFPDKPHFQYTKGLARESFKEGNVDLLAFNTEHYERTTKEKSKEF